ELIVKVADVPAQVVRLGIVGAAGNGLTVRVTAVRLALIQPVVALYPST
ncbi:hypothetical protein HMPREF0765_4919, partial [Sphingobacterium spiritivorum ATCC 33300]